MSKTITLKTISNILYKTYSGIFTFFITVFIHSRGIFFLVGTLHNAYTSSYSVTEVLPHICIEGEGVGHRCWCLFLFFSCIGRFYF